MVKSILIGLDGSPYSESAVNLGIEWAKRFDCLLVGLGVIDEPAMRGPKQQERMSPSYRAAYEAMVAQASHHVDALLERFTLRCTEAGVSNKLLEDIGSPYEQFMIEAQRYDMILLGQKTFVHTGSSVKECDTVDVLLHATPRPVIVVPKDVQPGSGILVAYDGSLPSSRSLQAFVGSGLAALGEVYVASVPTESAVVAGKIADRAVEYLRFHDISATRQTLSGSRCPSGDIMAEAQRLGVELVVMGSHGRSALSEFFLGSVTRNVVEQSKTPLFLYH